MGCNDEASGAASDEVNKDSSIWGNYNNYNAANNYTEGTAGYEKMQVRHKIQVQVKIGKQIISTT